MDLDRRLFTFAALSAPLYAGPWVLFTVEEAGLIEALLAQIVPADDSPGAREAGVAFYIDKQLAGPLKRFAPTYREAIPRFRQACREAMGREFTELPFAEQTAFLKQVEAGHPPGLASFFAMLVDHTMQGFYGSPEHGGNRDEASWKMLGITDVMEGHQP